MSIPVTPEIVESIYTMLCLTPPFNKWKLPEADDVHIEIVKTRKHHAWWTRHNDGRHYLCVSMTRHETLEPMIRSVAHEVAHMHTHKERALHGWQWKRAADLICKYHKWDRGQF